MLAKELFPGQFRPTPTHHFIRLLHDKGLLLRCFSQNIDSLETQAGLPRVRGGEEREGGTGSTKRACFVLHCFSQNMTLTQELPRVGEKGRRVEGGASKGTGTAGMGRPNWGWLRSRGADKVEEVAVVQESRGPEAGSTRVHAGWGAVVQESIGPESG